MRTFWNYCDMFEEVVEQSFSWSGTKTNQTGEWLERTRQYVSRERWLWKELQAVPISEGNEQDTGLLEVVATGAWKRVKEKPP